VQKTVGRRVRGVPDGLAAVRLAFNVLPNRPTAWFAAVFGGLRMTKRIACTIALVFLLAPAAAFAQIHQVGTASGSTSDRRNTFNFSLGYIGLKGLDSRSSDLCGTSYCDVLAADLLSEHPLL